METSTPRTRWNDFFTCRRSVPPLFLPAIYDYKAALAEQPAHCFGQRIDEIKTAIKREVESIQGDALTIGYDIYNVEAEAAGCRVLRDASLPMPQIEEPLLPDLEPADQLFTEIPRIAGRMPLFLEAAAWAVAEYGRDIPVRGAVSGPFSMAAAVCNRSALLTAVAEKPECLPGLLSWCTQWIMLYAEAFVRVGAEVIVFDSFASPPLISPRSYKELVLPFHQCLFHKLEEWGIKNRALIMGGNTISLLPVLMQSGANQFLLDFNIPLAKIREALLTFPAFFRVNLSPKVIAEESRETVARETRTVMEAVHGCTNYLLGTGILPYHTPLANIRQIRQVLEE